MAKRLGGKNELIKCEYCGELYSATYRRCPFCNGDGTGRWDESDQPQPPEEESAPRGGKRLAAEDQGGYDYDDEPRGDGPSVRQVLFTILSLALIAAAVCIVVSIVKPLLGGGKPKESQGPVQSQAVVSAQPTPDQSVPSAPAVESTEPSAAPSAEPSAPAVVSQPPATSVPAGTPTGFTLSKQDFTFFSKGESYRVAVTFQPAGATGTVTWTSDDPNIATVDSNGRVTAVSKGTVNVTAKVEGVGEKKCIVRCNFKDTAESAAPAQSSAPAQSAAPVSGLSLNREDFTLMSKGETFRMQVKGSDSAVTWSSSKPEVATVGSDGTVTAVSKGTCTITATVDGQTLKCIVRCRF